MTTDTSFSHADVPKLVLASASPRRQALLTEAGYVFTVDPADIDEENYPGGLLPSQIAEHLAFEKAKVVASRHPDAVVLGADTVVAFGDKSIGKATDANDARRILRLLSGTTHLVITGIAVISTGAKASEHRARVISAVTMRNLTEDAIERYIASGDWRGKAGAYGIQDSDPFVTRLTGSHTNVVGLPMAETRRLLEGAGILSPREARKDTRV